MMPIFSPDFAEVSYIETLVNVLAGCGFLVVMGVVAFAKTGL